MKSIKALEEPTPGLADNLDCDGEQACWNGFKSHQSGQAYRELFERLLSIQHGLCGYCEIDITEQDRQVEHVIPRSDPRRGALCALAHDNMIACCKGGTWDSGDQARWQIPVRKNRSCGEAKGGNLDPEFVDPRNLPELPSLTQVGSGGKIVANEAACLRARMDAQKENRTIDILGLNVERLRIAREKHWRALNENWKEHFGDLEVMMEAAREELLPDGINQLKRFFTTSRSFFDGLAEDILAENDEIWI